MTADLSMFNKVDDSVVDKYAKMSSFEIAAIFKSKLSKNLKGNRVVDAGRGNPNWFNAMGRLALNRLVELGVEEGKRVMTNDHEEMVGSPEKEGMFDRVMSALGDSDVDKFLRQSFGWAMANLEIDNKDAFMYDMIDGAIGDHYPVPDRILNSAEPILRAFLRKNHMADGDLADQTDLFPTEGGAMAMCYIFQEMKASELLNAGDTIAINSPIFTPYLQIPALKEYQLNVKEVLPKAENDWQMTDEQLDELKDPKVKAFFATNPMNPPARAFNDHVMKKLQEVVKANPNLIILTDDVYGTFAPAYTSLYNALPHNTILVYSFSKLYGVTGHRLGLVAVNKDNVMDKLIQEKAKNDPEVNKDYVDRYSIISGDPVGMKWIDRLCADSRSVGLAHVAGLSTHEQIQECMMAFTSLIHNGVDPYMEESRVLTRERHDMLWDTLGLEDPLKDNNSAYYCMVSIYDLMSMMHGDDFAEWFKKNYTVLHFEYRLAVEYGGNVMDTMAFGAPEGYVRVSFANLSAIDYKILGEDMRDLVDEFYAKYQEEK